MRRAGTIQDARPPSRLPPRLSLANSQKLADQHTRRQSHDHAGKRVLLDPVADILHPVPGLAPDILVAFIGEVPYLPLPLIKSARHRITGIAGAPAELFGEFVEALGQCGDGLVRGDILITSARLGISHGGSSFCLISLARLSHKENDWPPRQVAS